jgi:uncharacterized membrane protein YozB (DUF420 family)
MPHGRGGGHHDSKICDTTEFAVRRPTDRTFFLVNLLIIWVAMLGGFGLDMVQKAAKGKLDYPLIIHVHAVVFGGWLILLTVQMLLIRRGDYATHRKLGVVALVLLPLMLVLGPAAAITMLRLHFNDPHLDTAFMATQLTNVFGSVVLSSVGLLMRRDAAAHKRLMLLGTIAIAEPGSAASGPIRSTGCLATVFPIISSSPMSAASRW